MASHVRDAGVNVYLDIWHNKAGTEIEKFSGKILEEETDFVVLAGSKNLMTKYTSPDYAKLERGSVVKLELGMVAQRAMGPIHTIIPIALEGAHKEVFPKFLWNSVSIGFQDRDQYRVNCFSLLERLYQLSYDDPYLERIKEEFKLGLSPIKNLLKIGGTEIDIKLSSQQTLPSSPKTKRDLEKEALQGNRQAAYVLAMLYLEGKDIRKDIPTGLQWLEKAAEESNEEAGYILAQRKLAQMYMNGEEGIEKDYKQALKWIDLLVEQGDPRGQFLLGELYTNGWGLTQDYAEAFKWYKKAAEQNHAEAKEAVKKLEEKSNNNASIGANINPTEAVSRPVVSDIVIPEIAKGYEEIYRRFVMGKLIYKPDSQSDEGRIELPIRALANPLEGTFDLSQCGDSGKYLSISTGYRKGKKAENADKVEVWLAPRFLIEKELQRSASHFKPIMNGWSEQAAPVGIFWTWGGYDNLEYYDYLISQGTDTISSKDLYNSWLRAGWHARLLFRWSCGGRVHAACSCFICELK